MFKRVKTLLVSGLLVMGMAVPAFADGETTLDKVTQNYLNSMKIGAVKDGIRTIDAVDFISTTKWENFMKGINDKAGDGLHIIANPDANKGDYLAYYVYFDANFDGDLDYEEKTIIETILIDINNEKAEDKGIIGPITPGTGDTLALGGLAVAAVAAGGLTIVNKKNKNK